MPAPRSRRQSPGCEAFATSRITPSRSTAWRTSEAVAALFEGATDPMVVVRWKDLFERLEAAIDATEHAANILETIVIKNS